MVRYYEANGIPLERIDNTGFMVGTTGTCYRRGTEAWEGMLILEHARGAKEELAACLRAALQTWQHRESCSWLTALKPPVVQP